jgi:transposase
MKNKRLIPVGIDWAEAEHAFHLIDSDGPTICGSFSQDPQAIEELLDAWRKRFPGSTFAVSIETTKGPLISALLKYHDVVIYPVNPAALASYRKAFAHGGGKNDPGDAALLAESLENYLDKLRPLRQDEPLTRELASLAEDRRRLVDQRTAHCNELKAVLKRYFPVVMQLKAAKIYAVFILRFLTKYPTLADAQKAGENKLRKFFYGVGTKRKVEDRVRLIVDAMPLTEDEVLLRTSARRAIALVRLIETYNGQVDRYDSEIKELVCQHADYPIVASFSAGSYVTRCRLIAALGDDRSRFPKATSLQNASGIAPLTTQSGKMKFVSSRWACSKFMKQTFHEFAGLTITKSKWAAAYYKQQRDKGKSAQVAKRALAYKWQRIIHRCWQDRVPYDEQRYIERLRVTGSPLIALMDADSTSGKSV